MRRGLLAVFLATALALPACGGGDSGTGSGSGGAGGSSSCVKDLSTTCSPLYDPTFDNIYTRTLQPSCALSGASCHSAEGNQGGLALADADSAYAALLGKDGGSPRVVAGDPGCSLLIERLESTDADVVMPKGGRLSEAERCVFVKWVAAGAAR